MFVSRIMFQLSRRAGLRFQNAWPTEQHARIKDEFRKQSSVWSPLAAGQTSTTLRAPQVVDRIINSVPLNPGDHVLEVACGSGILSSVMAGKVRNVTGIDISPDMLREAKRAATQAGLSNTRFLEGPAERLSFEDGTFDAVVTRLSMHHFADPERCFKEMVRVVRPGGAICVADIFSSEDAEKSALFNRIERVRDPSHVRFMMASELKGLFERENLNIVNTEQFQMLRHVSEWLKISQNMEKEADQIRTLMVAAMENDAAGIQIALEQNGDLRFMHHWLVVVATK